MEELTPQRLSLRRNFSWSFLGDTVYSGCLWAMLMAMTKLLPIEEVGMFVLATALITPLEMFTNLQLRGVQGSDAKNEYCFGEYFALRILSVFVLFATSVFISMFLQKGIHMIMVMVAVGLYKCVDCYADITYGLLQKYERLDRVAISRITRGIIGSTVFITVVWLTRNIVLGFLVVAVAWAVVFILLDISSVRRFEKPVPVFRTKRLVTLATISVPLGITMTIMSLNTKIPSYFTEKYLGSADLGYLGVLAYIIAALRTAIGAMGFSAFPRLSRYYIDNLRAYVKLLGKMVFVAAGLGLVGVLFAIFFGRYFLRFAYTSDYAEYNELFIWLLVAGGMGYIGTMLCIGLTAARLFKVQVPLATTVTVVVLIASWTLIPHFGVVGAAWAMLAGSLTITIGALAIIIWNIVFRVKHIGVKSE